MRGGSQMCSILRMPSDEMAGDVMRRVPLPHKLGGYYGNY